MRTAFASQGSGGAQQLTFQFGPLVDRRPRRLHVQGGDPDSNGDVIFTIYAALSRKPMSQIFGTATPTVAVWQATFPDAELDGVQVWTPTVDGGLAFGLGAASWDVLDSSISGPTKEYPYFLVYLRVSAVDTHRLWISLETEKRA